MVRLRSLVVLVLVVLCGGAAAQNIGGPLSSGVVQSPVLVIEFDRVFSQSAFGRRVSAEIEAEGATIAAENRKIEAELIAEERALTEQRAEMDTAAFRELADAFDVKVQRIRAEQDAKARALGQRNEAARRRFLAAAQPVIEGLMRESGAAVILDRRTVFVANEAVDLTDRAIDGIDAQIGDGADLEPLPEPGTAD